MSSIPTPRSSVDLPKAADVKPLRVTKLGQKAVVASMAAAILLTTTTWIGFLGWGLFSLLRATFSLL